MTDNEIVKAKKLIKKLEEAYNAYYDTSKCMPYDIDKTLRETAICLENSLDEINRQKIEIEKQKEFNKELLGDCVKAYAVCEHAKNEAIKEFAERVKAKFSGVSLCNNGFVNSTLDSLVKEMVGDAE